MYVRFCAYCQQHSEEGGLCAANTGTEHGKKYDQYSWNKHMTKQWRKYIEYLYSSLHNDRSVSKISVTLRFRWPASTASTRGSTTMSKWRRTSAHATVSGIAIFSSRVGSLFVANLRLNHCLDHIPYSFIDLPSDVRDYVIENKKFLSARCVYIMIILCFIFWVAEIH